MPFVCVGRRYRLSRYCRIHPEAAGFVAKHRAKGGLLEAANTAYSIPVLLNVCTLLRVPLGKSGGGASTGM